MQSIPAEGIVTQRTKSNLEQAMKNEAFGVAKYAMFAARARMDEKWDLAKFFQRASDTERLEILAREAELAGIPTTSIENLQAAIQQESKQIADYAGFASDAKADGDTHAAMLFQRVSGDKERNRAELEAQLDKLGLPNTLKAVGA